MIRCENDFVCPIDGTPFKAWVERSGSSFGKRLDFKNLGCIAQPWSVPQCPKCKFILFKTEFEPHEIEKFKAIVNLDTYKKINPKNTTYFYLAKINELQGGSSFNIAWTYLQASWQTEDTKEELYKNYLRESIAHFVKACKEFQENKENFDDYLISFYLCIELNRRLGEFEEALKTLNAFPDASASEIKWLPQVLEYQKKRTEAKDSGPHAFAEAMPEEEDSEE